MKPIHAKATMSQTAKTLFADRAVARETFRKIIETRSEASGEFKIGRVRIRTERAESRTGKKTTR
jgi:hypothetical protein